MSFNIGSKVECTLSEDEQNAYRARDAVKARKRGVSFHVGNAAAYMHLNEAYVVEAITPKGGLKLRGFAPTVSPKNVQLSTKPTYR